jgi:predicted ATP-dependent endonuclease of OLD family
MRKSSMAGNTQARLYIVCEGETDKVILGALIRRILIAKHIEEGVFIVAAGAKLPVPNLVQGLENQLPADTKFGIVVDSDGDIESTKSFLRRHLDLHQCSIVIAHPSLQSWFGLSEDQTGANIPDGKKIQQLVDRIDLDQLAREHPEFEQLLEMITELGTGPVRASSALLSSRDVRSKTYSRR